MSEASDQQQRRPSIFLRIACKILPKLQDISSSPGCTFHGFGYDYKTDDYNTSGVLLNGAVHWLRSRLSETSSAMIVSMHISEERFEELQLPMTLPTTLTIHEMNMGVLEECLCALAHMQRTFQVWVMQDYGVSESWTKLYTITFESMPCCVYFDVKLIESFKDGEILFKNQCRVTLYDPKHGATRKPNINIHGLIVRKAVILKVWFP
ncbi:F-box protein At3g07870-like [Papaver somniferum]|uniref:F-box protein At3g07870-like n=1 Tax=Papaver somniferum TaxID=3469 RepID=UPI000E6F803C|nr:F-box protein At3g07870-like [Papaver somniferum]